MNDPQIGDSVLYVLPEDSKCSGQYRPAVIVQAWSNGYYNLQVFVDGTNDYANYSGHMLWVTSVKHSVNRENRTFFYANEEQATDMHAERPTNADG